jgi:hypothetical protein
MNIRNFPTWLIAFVVRVLIWGIMLIRVPFIILQTAAESIADLLERIAIDLRNSCPWPWVKRIEATLKEYDRTRLDIALGRAK